MNKSIYANRNTANYHLYHALMEALIANEIAMDKEITRQVHSKDERHESRCFWLSSTPTKDDEQRSKKTNGSPKHAASKQHPTLTSTGWQITDTRDAVVDSSMPRSDTESEHSEQSSDDIPMQDEGHVSDMEDTDNAHIPKVSTTTWFKPIPEGERPATPEPEWTIPPNDFPEPENNWANTYATTYKVPAENKLQRKTYDIGSFIKWFCRRTERRSSGTADLEVNAIYISARYYGITHWWFRRKEFYINKHSEPFDREAVRSHMLILSLISVKVFEKYGYNYLIEIILRRADYQEYKISEKDFKNLHPNNFEDLYLLNIQEKLNHLPKTSPSTQQSTMSWTKMVKDFHLYEYNKGMETRKWSEDDKRRSKDFITAIEKRLQIRGSIGSLEALMEEE
ncbi:hypothetical protein Tco_1262623 [Tanacetum coccineum]